MASLLPPQPVSTQFGKVAFVGHGGTVSFEEEVKWFASVLDGEEAVGFDYQALAFEFDYCFEVCAFFLPGGEVGFFLGLQGQVKGCAKARNH